MAKPKQPKKAILIPARETVTRWRFPDGRKARPNEPGAKMVHEPIISMVAGAFGTPMKMASDGKKPCMQIRQPAKRKQIASLQKSKPGGLEKFLERRSWPMFLIRHTLTITVHTCTRAGRSPNTSE